MREPAEAVARAVAEAHRHEWARVLAATARLTRDLDLAQECTQDAYVKALEVWPRTGIPDRPGAWLTTAARNRATDTVRRASTLRRALPMLVVDEVLPGPEDGAYAASGAAELGELGDDRLRLIFTCCHPALEPAARIALTLRLVCGLSTAEVASAFLVQESTMAARITRAKKKIHAARIPYRVPSRADLPARTGSVLEVVHLVFTTGHAAPDGRRLVRDDLLDRALDLARLLHRLLPGDAATTALLALILLTDARRATRVTPDGALILLADQDRSRWDRDKIDEGRELLLQALAARPPGNYALQAAIAAVHADAPTWADTDWAEIVAIYDELRRQWPSPVVDLNRAVAVGQCHGPAAGLAALTPLLDEPALAGYSYLAAVRADLLRRLGRRDQAAVAYDEAIALTDNDVERAFLEGRLAEVRAEPRDRAEALNTDPAVVDPAPARSSNPCVNPNRRSAP